ncbi:MAG TPA: universal stress protein [Solirubrobacterales bacterium]|nr:universal stress protein [Solirubrobacterales bacterium]
MHDDLHSEPEGLTYLDGVTPPIFRGVLTIGEDEEGRRDAIALAGVIAEWSEPVATAEAADLIVVGSAVGAGAGRVLVGEAGRALFDGSRCPVVAAPRGYAAADDHEIRRVDIGIDGSREAGAALNLAARIARAHDAKLRVIAIAEPTFDLGGTLRPVDTAERQRLSRHLDHAADGLPGIWIETELREGLPDQILLGLAREAGLLVLGSRATYGDAGRVTLGGTGERILRASPAPVLLVPAP